MAEEEEVLLENGPVHQYLLKNTSFHCSLFSKEALESRTNNISPFSVTNIEISAETKELLEILLNSSLMLEDDAQWLHLLSERTEIKYERLHLKTLLCCAGIIITGFASLFFSSYRKIWFGLFVGSTISTMYATRRLMSDRTLHKTVVKLCDNMHKTYAQLKNHFSFIADFIRCVSTKEMLYNSHEYTQEREKYEWAKEAITSVSTELMFFLFEAVNVCKSSTLALIEAMSDIPASMNILAFCNDEQLGLSMMISRCENGELSLSMLEQLRHLFILLQSQLLRLLGYYACQLDVYSKRNQVSNILNSYNYALRRFITKKLSNYNLLDMEIKLAKRKTCSAALNRNLENKNRAELFKAVENAKLYLHSILADVIDIEDILSIEEPANSLYTDIESEIDNLSIEIEEVNFALREVKRLLNKERESIVNVIPLPTVDNAETDNENEQKPLIEVGKTDFSINSPDEVFLRVPGEECDIDSNPSSEHQNNLPVLDPDTKVFDFYQKVLYELQETLKQKKEEYQKRELVAAGAFNPKIKEFINSMNQDIPTCSSRKDTEETPEEILPETYDITAHKALALKAVSMSQEWKRKNEDESNYES